MKFKYEKSIIYFSDDNVGDAFTRYANNNIALKDSQNALKISDGNNNYIDCSINVADAFKKGWQECMRCYGLVEEKSDDSGQQEFDFGD